MYIDIHVHNLYPSEDTFLLRNIFPDKLYETELPGYYSIGLHPWYIDENMTEEIMVEISETSERPSVLAVGETGLDSKVNIRMDLQMKVFQKHIEIAEKIRKPLIIHCVKAYNELLSLRKKSDQDIPWIFHWFNSGLEMAMDLIGKNCYLSYGISLFKEESKAFRAFKNLPPDRIFFETDDVGIGIKQVYEKASSVLGIPVDDLKQQIRKNFNTCFPGILF